MMKSGTEFIYGLRPLMEAVESGKEIEKIFFRKDLHGDNYHELLRTVKGRSIPFQYVPVEKLNRITRKNHQGVVAFISPITYHKLDQIIPSIYELGEDPFLILLEGITDVGNFGAIARTAECAGVHALVISPQHSAPVNADSLKTSAGALSRLPVCRVPGLFYAVKYLKDSGLVIFGTTEKADKLYYQARYSGPCAFVMGSEDKGITNSILKKCDELIKIPLMGRISSLNVSAAAAILIYEAVRQRNENPGPLNQRVKNG